MTGVEPHSSARFRGVLNSRGLKKFQKMDGRVPAEVWVGADLVSEQRSEVGPMVAKPVKGRRTRIVAKANVLGLAIFLLTGVVVARAEQKPGTVAPPLVAT